YNSFVQFDFVLKFTGGFIINDTLAGIRAGFDFCPRRENGKFVLPGSSIRRVLRSQAETIARTVRSLHSTRDEFRDKRLARKAIADLNSPLRSSSNLVREHKKKEKNKQHQISEEQFYLACRFLGSPDRGSRLQITDGYRINTPKI